MTSAPPGWYMDPWHNAPLRWFDGVVWTPATTAAPGWYADPWGIAPLRWFDGSVWTPAETVAAIPRPPVTDRVERQRPEPESSAYVPPLRGVLGAGAGLAVIDVETTGLGRTDRVVEIAIITLDETGTVLDEFETLVNPHRDIGPTRIHGLTASMVADAPSFDEIAQSIAARLHGHVVVGHNIRFDTRMIGQEFERVGLEIDWGAGLDTLAITRRKLRASCAEHGIVLDDAHRAVADARATAALLTRIATGFDRPGVPVVSRATAVAETRIVVRDSSATVVRSPAYLADLAHDIYPAADLAGYVVLLDQALEDLQLHPDERADLEALAEDLGLSEHDVKRAHRQFLAELIDLALEDGVVTDEELDRLVRVAALLDLDPTVVGARTDLYRFATDAIALREGLTVCFTGDAVVDGESWSRERLHELASAHGLAPVTTVTAKGCGLLVAADPGSLSGKAKSAHKYGTPIAAVEDFVTAARAGHLLPVRVLRHHGTVCVCERCGDSWTASRRGAVCKPCRRRPSRTAGDQRAEPSEAQPVAG